MATHSYSNHTCLSLIFLLLITMISSSQLSAQLSVNFYATTCPSVFNTIRTATQAAVAREPRMAASLLRLHFHDCFVNGCDGSVLLVDNGTFTGEQNVQGNRDSLRGFDVVDSIKTQVDAACGRNVVSCADILAVAARDSVVLSGGQTYAIPVGRRDARTANPTSVNDLPAFFETLDVLLQKFSNKGFTAREMVALSGGHTIGQARCTTFRDHIYNQTADIDPPFRTLRQANCPRTGGDNNLAPFDSPTPNDFDNSYFRELISKRGLLQSDQALFNNGSTDAIVTTYSTNANVFATDFGLAMIKMGALSPLTGTQGEVRIDCKRVN